MNFSFYPTVRATDQILLMLPQSNELISLIFMISVDRSFITVHHTGVSVILMTN